MQYLNKLLLFDNMINGTIPPDLRSCSSLVEIKLQDNLIGGTIPHEICNLQSVEIF